MTPTSFAGVVVTASGNIPGQTHESIQRMVEECGARFERLKVTDCTHLITTKSCVQNATRKINAIQKGTNCEVVNIKWLVDSVQNKHPVSTDSYLLKPTTDNVPGGSQLIQSSLDRPKSNKRKLGEDTDTIEESPKVQRSNLHVYRKQLISLVDDRYDTKGAQVALWMDEHNVRWDALLINNLTKNSTPQVKAYTPEYSVSMHRLQILYILETDKYYTWFRHVDDKTEEGELYGNGDLKSAIVEFKRLFKRQAWMSWEGYLLSHARPCHFPAKDQCIILQPPSEDERQMIAQGFEQPQVPIKIPEGVLGLLKLLFGHPNKMATQYLFNEVANAQLQSIGRVQLDEDILQTAIAVLDMLDDALTDTAKRKVTRNSPSSQFMLQQTSYLKQCYFALLGIVNRPISEPLATDHDWLNRERENVHLLLKLRIALKRAALFYNNAELSQQAFQALGLTEIKKVRKGSQEYKGLYEYLHSSVGSLHTVQYKEIINVFRIERRGESERYHKWRAANSDKIGQRYLLWHGSGCERFIGILSQGLRANIFEKSGGGMFGAGVYFADMSGKAARYSRGPANMALMLLCEVEIGNNPLVLEDCNRDAVSTLHTEGKVAVVAHGRSNHTGWQNAKKIHRRLDGVYMPDVKLPREHRPLKTLAYNEYVVYNPAQVQQRYLFHLKTG